MRVVIAVARCAIRMWCFVSACRVPKYRLHHHARTVFEATNNFVAGNERETHPVFKVWRCVSFNKCEITAANPSEYRVKYLPTLSGAFGQFHLHMCK